MPCTSIFAFLLVSSAGEIIFHCIHGVCPVEHHGSFAVLAVDKTGKNVLLCHIGPAAFAFADVLHYIPSGFVDNGFMSIFNSYLLTFRTLNSFLVFVGQGCVL